MAAKAAGRLTEIRQALRPRTKHLELGLHGTKVGFGIWGWDCTRLRNRNTIFISGPLVIWATMLDQRAASFLPRSHVHLNTSSSHDGAAVSPGDRSALH